MFNILVLHSVNDEALADEIVHCLNDDQSLNQSRFFAKKAIEPTIVHSTQLPWINDYAGIVVICTNESIAERPMSAAVRRSLSSRITTVLLECGEVNLPRRWASLPLVQWHLSSRIVQLEAIGNLLKLLPPNSYDKYRNLLNTAPDFCDLKQMLLQHFEWLPCEYLMFNEYEFIKFKTTDTQIRLSCFAFRQDTMGLRGMLYYFQNPWLNPFSDYPLGKWIDDTIKTDIERTPSTLFDRDRIIERQDFIPFPSPCGSLRIFLVAGRKWHFDNAAAYIAAAKSRVEMQWIEDRFHSGRFEILSYDDLMIDWQPVLGDG